MKVMAAHDDRDAVFFGNCQSLFDVLAVTEVFNVHSINGTAFDSIVQEREVVAFGNVRFAAFSFRAEGKQDGIVR